MSTNLSIPSGLSFLNKSETEQELEFSKLSNAQFNTRFEAAKLPEFSVGTDIANVYRNRYSNILANNSTRVKLEDRKADYINANHCLAGRIIICQGPQEEASSTELFPMEDSETPHGDFYHMLWTNESSAIAMVTDYVEKHSVKCSYYLPNASEVKKTREYSVIALPDDSPRYQHLKELGILTTKVIIEKGLQRKTLTHFQYPQWGDTLGAGAKPVAALARALLMERKPVIHCSAGIGRSGTLAAVMRAYARILAGPVPSTLVFDSVDALRLERRGCVQTLPQYKTIYSALQELVEYDTEIIVKCRVPYPFTLTIRGQGAGLNWDKGVPLQKIDDETYVYRTKGITEKVEYKILLNDTVWENGMNHSTKAEKTQECSPSLAIPKVPVAVDIEHGDEKLFIRGTGPGMSWDKGIELKCINGKCYFETPRDDIPFEFKILRNDTEWEKGANHRTEPNKTRIVSPLF